jgi:hypothetical protein
MAASVWDSAWQQLQTRHKLVLHALKTNESKPQALNQMVSAIVATRLALKTLGQTITPTEAKWESQALKDLYEQLEILKWRTKDLRTVDMSKPGFLRVQYLRYLGVLSMVRERVEQCKFELDKREQALPDLPIAVDLGTVKGQTLVQAKLFREHLLREVTEPGVRSQLAFEKMLQLGEVVQVRWPWGSDTYTAPGKIVNVSKQSFTVELAVPVLFEDRRVSWPKGHQIVVPRLTGMGRKWSVQNGVFPV